MPTDTQFATDWLEERYRFDVAARNPKVEAACLQYFAQHPMVSIIDIGAGTGANFIYLSEKFPQSQQWALVELNPNLLKRARERLKIWAAAKGYTVRENGQRLDFQRSGQHIHIQLLQGSLLELPRLLQPGQYQLVTASAVFDLLSKQMLSDLIQTFHHNRLALLTTLNYESMAYLPGDAEDKRWIELYEAHMQREQDFGRALGPGCSDFLENGYAQLPTAQTLRAPSRWQIEPADTSMHGHMLQFLEKSLLEMTSMGHSGKGLDAWLQRKKTQLQAQQLRLSVVHSDFFTAPVYEG
ncbi:class I SAM-dependent methyltransferase [Phaeodactylibacter sp.]|uniref:class I SAM-dependent methyltransferase n=1 Tax=Phaeodactylibacter sp. TaxID=1940289 RepID=UPI0025D90CB0|nr:class I SAM-dependent methyltransferase [Phaeodactylibacter sp.]MCI4647387.1 class I SAM-dependent methyltransferase [Phaeodactylibacter sp.]MCI5094158.1 class I SAM-dependent methyltransferase [Phaeodactylibacter sp.]